MLAHTTNPRGILMLNLLMAKDMKWRKCRKTGHGRFLEMRNSAYYCPYDLASSKVNVIYFIYKIRNLDGSGISDNYRGICFLNDDEGTRCSRRS